MRALLDPLLGLVLPGACAGCGAVDAVWCAACAPTLTAYARREDGCPRLDRMDGSAPLPVWTAGRYAGPVRSAVLAWKDGGRSELTGVMAAAAAGAAHSAAAALGSAVRGAGGPLVVVGVPARAAAVRRRGGDLVGALADAASAELGSLGAQRASPLVRRGSRSQVTLGARERGRNASGYVVTGPVDPHALHLLVDDVVTTGATLAACTDAIAAAGGLVVGAVAVAATPFTRSALHPGGAGD